MEPPRCPHPCLSFSRAEQDEQARPHPGSVGTDPCTAVNTAAGERSAGRLRVAQGHRQFTPAPLLPRTLPRWSGLRAGVAEDRSQRSGAVPELPDPVGLTRHRHTVSHRPGPRNRFLLPPCSGTARLCFAPCERPSPATHPRYPRDRSAPRGLRPPPPILGARCPPAAARGQRSSGCGGRPVGAARAVPGTGNSRRRSHLGPTQPSPEGGGQHGATRSSTAARIPAPAARQRGGPAPGTARGRVGAVSAHLRGRGRRNPAGRSLPSAEPGDCPVRGGGRHPTDRFLAAFSPRADPRRAGRGARCAPCGCSAPASLPPRSPGLRRCRPSCYPRGAARPSVGRFPVPGCDTADGCSHTVLQTPKIQTSESPTGAIHGQKIRSVLSAAPRGGGRP